MSSRNGDDALPIVILAIGAFIAFCIWKFAQMFGLDFKTAVDVLLRLVPVLAIWGAVLYLTDFTIGKTLPALLAAIWFSWWPALDYWSNPNQGGTDVFGGYGFAQPAWYAMWYSKWGILALILGAGYAIRALLDD